MSGSWLGNMRAPRVKAPLLLLLLLLTALTGTVFCQDDDDAPVEPSVTVDQDLGSNTTETVASGEDEDAVTVETPVLLQDGCLQTEDSTEGNCSGTVTTTTEELPELDPIIIIIPIALVVFIIGMIVCGICITCKWNKKKRNPDLSKEDPYLDGSSTEKVPMPMFEEDVPSVLELEMEELDQWMKKDG
ncbi:transmembrane protein 154 isoform X2 [Archocentrus centrarchus]|nr:transmembrane protein 154 isoform X2 [Archocentrus centrarchus]